MKRIVITGAAGFVASVIRLYNQDQYEFIPITRKEIDFSKPETVYPCLSGLQFDVLIHTAANAVTEFCAAHPELAHAINVESANEAARAAKDQNARFVFISTEQVFNGRSDKGPFRETDEPCCVTNYGNYKLEAEQYIQETLQDYIILRLSSMFGLPMPGVKPSSNFLMRTWTALKTETPAMFTPYEQRGMTYIMHLADHLTELLALPSGIYHVTSRNDLTTYDLCRRIGEALGYPKEKIDAFILPDYDRYADRFRDYRLDGSKLRDFGLDFGTMEEDLARCLKDFGWSQK
jgi:dTDP-4-dehydrorhamnose reductase